MHWQNLYSFEFAHVCAGDIQTSNFFVSSYPESFFFNNRIAAFPTDKGSVLLFNHSLKLISEGITTEIELQEDDTYLDAIQRHFGIDLAAPIQALKPVASE